MPWIMKYRRLLIALLAANLASAILFFFRLTSTNTDHEWYLFYNLLLAWAPAVLAALLIERLKTTPWSSWPNALITFLWLMMLPNSFYIASDLVHLENIDPVGKLYDAVMILSFAFNGFLLGYISLYLVHHQLLKRVRAQTAHTLIAWILLVCSFAIYLGRNLRWNSWDVLISPAGLVFDVSERILHPVSHAATFKVTLIFFLLISSVYWVVWEFAAFLQAGHVPAKRGRG